MAMSMAARKSMFSRAALHLKMTNLRVVQLATIPDMAMAGSTNNLNTSSLSPVKAVELFYSSINDNNLEQLQDLVAEDCYFEDTFFANPPRGKQEVMRFLERLTEAMGSDLKFRLEQTAGGEGTTVGVTWHFELRNKQVPLTKGCSFYEFSKDGGQLLIKQARAVMEPAIKPGNIALAVFSHVFQTLAPFLNREHNTA